METDKVYGELDSLLSASTKGSADEGAHIVEPPAGSRETTVDEPLEPAEAPAIPLRARRAGEQLFGPFTPRMNGIPVFVGGYTEPEAVTTGGGGPHVFVSLCVGETHVSIVTGEGRLERKWTAAWGWSAFTTIALDVDTPRGSEVVHLTEEDLLARAIAGSLRMYGKLVDTSGFVGELKNRLQGALEVVLSATVGEAARYDSIVLAGPPWLHSALEGMTTLRPHISAEIRDL